ncbi:MAG: class I mannose-6-phosphate isomerase [Candidatus Heimdallarchaeota archaeon]|nr:class I mannose-6-phosphate isomerase [Candidatus Heimdallarchaeota archaeon]
MRYINFTSGYDRFPKSFVDGYDDAVIEGYPDILQQIKTKISDRMILILETYPGVNYEELKINLIDPLDPVLILCSEDAAFTPEDYHHTLARHITDDRVFGVLSVHQLIEFFYPSKIQLMRQQIANSSGLIVIYGVGASLITEGDLLIYCNLARWEIQQRYRKGMPNWRTENSHEDRIRKFKRGYFIEWRLADRLKKQLFGKMDYLLDTNIKNNPKLINYDAFEAGLRQLTQKPFRLVPYFDAGVWGGQWMKDVCNLDPQAENYAWCFDGVPEENSIYLAYGEKFIEIPAIDLVLMFPIALLGNKVHARFGAEFPIRFDFLDTMEGQNLSLQVHPLTEYIQETFGMHYTQDESYYILDAREGAKVYLGVKEGIDKKELLQDLRRAESGEISFPDEKYINTYPAKKHDHFLIPGGTIHCSGANSMVLEISSTPYIFTFKLWDWGRVGLDGIPRPLHINHGEKVIQFDRDAQWIEKELVNRIEVISDHEGIREERTGLHEREFIETRRHWSKNRVFHDTDGVFNMLNLVEGQEAIVESPSNKFSPFIVHYAETFIIPANVGEYTIRPHGPSEGSEIATIKAYVRV